MPVKKGKSNLVHDTFDVASIPADPHKARGRLVLATGNLAVDSTDEIGSKYHLLDLPATALLHEDTFFDVANLPLANVRIGTHSDGEALVSQSQATEDMIAPIAVGDASHDKELWEILGLEENPGGVIGIWVHAIANATGDGAMPFRLAYIVA